MHVPFCVGALETKQNFQKSKKQVRHESFGICLLHNRYLATAATLMTLTYSGLEPKDKA